MSTGEQTAFENLAASLRGGPFRAQQLLKREHGIDTWRAVDRDGHDVVIKMLPVHTTSGRRLALELDVLGELGRAGTALPVQTAASDGVVALARPFVRGPTLREQLASHLATVADVIALASALFDTLDALHARGLVHGDIKPSNIVLAEGAWSSPVLVDFGVPRHVLLGDAREAIAPEAVLYLAPEQAGLLERGIDARADLYAVGLCMYEAIAGPPFSASTVSELLREQLTVSPALLSTRVPGVPDGLARVVERLLRKDPRDRYQTAAGVRADLAEIAAALERGVAADEIVIGSRDPRATITEPAFTGRRDELQQLTRSIDDAVHGRGGVVVLEGESGSGKTWLLEELARRAIHRGLWVVRGQGSAQVAQRPYHVLSTMARDIGSSASAGSARPTRLVERAGAVSASIVESLPITARIFGAPSPPSLLEPNAEERSLAALAVLLDALGSSDEPALVLLDDMQWTDAQTLRLLERWQAGGAVGDRHTVVVLAFRSEDVDREHPLRRLATTGKLALARFSDDEVRQQVASMAGDLPASVVELVVAHAAGNPFLATALLHGLTESKVLVRDASGWQFAEAALHDLQVSAQMAAALTAWISPLSPAARRLLTVGALLGKTFDPLIAGELCDLDARDALAIVRELRGRLVWLHGSSCVFVHDRIREALLADLASDERRRLHLEAAQRLPADRVFELAYHYDAAGAPERAFPHAIEAAERARSQHDMELAERYYRMSVRGLGDGTARETRFRVARGLGEVLLVRSRYEECARWLDEAFELAPDAAARADLEERRAQLALKQGNLPGAIEHGERALRLVDRYVPRSSFVCLLIVLWEAFVQVLHTRFPRWFVGRRTLEGADDEMFAIRVYNGLNGPYFFARGAVWVLWAHLRALNLSERYPPSRALGREYGNHGSACAGFPSLFERAVRYTKRGAEICAELGDIWGQARALQFHALNLCATGRYREAIAAGELGGQLFDRAGDEWNAQFALNWASLARYRMGDLAGATASAKQLYDRGKRLDSALGISFALDAWVRAVEGRVPANLVQDELARRDEHVQTWSIMAQSEAIRLLAQDQPAEAEALLETWLRRMKQERAFFHESNISMTVYLGAAQRRRAQQLAATDPAQSARLLARAVKTSRRAVKLTRRFANCIPHALREAALTEAMAGRVGKARQLIGASVAAAEQLDAPFELALSREVQCELGPVLTGTPAAKALERARGELAALRAPLVEATTRVTVSLIDRFEVVLEVGRRIASSLVADDVHVALRDGALALLRAQHASILDARESVLHGDVRVTSSALAAEARRRNAPVVWSEGNGSLAGDPVLVRSAVRSALCAPIVVRGEIAALLYVTHAEVRDAFGDEEQKLASFLIALAGAALENADGFARIQSLSRDLERRVEERTAELATANRALADNLRRLEETQEQLLHAGRMAAVGTLIAGLSHELNNPLSVILGNAENLAALATTDHRAAKMIDAITRNGQRAARLVGTLLRFSRTRSVASDHVNPEQLIRMVLELIAPEARTREIELRGSVPHQLPELAVARHEVESALVNLATNALHATSEGGTVELRAVAETREHRDGICFVVHDTGCGIPPDALERIFDPFFTTKPEGEGTGLGLSLARQTATAHGGWLDAESEVGRGTTMRLWLPLVPRPGA